MNEGLRGGIEREEGKRQRKERMERNERTNKMKEEG